ncbi:MAG: hypothetical protein AAFW70_20465 [Cyanobacteria bacterium J06635_10]
MLPSLENGNYINQHLEGLLLDTQTLKNILIFLCSIPPETNLRLVLQLALAANIPDDKREEINTLLLSNRSLENLLGESDILTQILEADGKLGEAEENMLFEAMQLIGLVVPSNLSGAKILLEELSQNLIQEIKLTSGADKSHVVSS